MANALNSLVQSNKKPAFTQIISSPSYQTMLASAIQDETTRQRFVTSIISVVSSNEKVAACTPKSIISAGLKCISYGFMPGGELGDVYLVPYGDTCVFQLGYKGMVRLVQRSGMCKTLNMGTVQRGETVKFDKLTGDIQITGEPESTDAPAIGYFAFMRLNGSNFEKAEYMTKEQAIAHAARYAKNTGFDRDTFKRYETYLETGEGMTKAEADRLSAIPNYGNFDQMATKNVLRRLLLRWSPMSIDFQQALEEDERQEKGEELFGINVDIANEAKPEEPEQPTPAEPEAAVTEEPQQKKAGRPKATKTADDDFFN